MTNKDYEILGFLKFIDGLPTAEKIAKFKEYSKAWYNEQRRAESKKASKYENKEFIIDALKLKVVVYASDSIIAEVVGSKKSYNVDHKVFNIMIQLYVGMNFIVEGVDYTIYEVTSEGYVGVYTTINNAKSYSAFCIDNLATKLAKEYKV
jgi:hypothetical protein